MRKSAGLRGIVLAGAFVFAGLGAAHAAPLIYVDDARGNVGTLDVATRTVTVLGNAGTVLTDIAFSPAQDLLGVSFTNLYSVNKTTGAATPVGALGVGSVNGLVFRSDGTLFASGGNNLYTVNTTTGTATLVGSTGLAGLTSAGDLAFLGGTLYETVTNGSVSDLISVNTSTGAGTLIGTIVKDPNMFGLVNVNGTLYGVDGTNLYTIDPLTGAGTLLGGFGGQGLIAANGAANAAEAIPPVPEPASLGLMAVSLTALGLIRRKGKG